MSQKNRRTRAQSREWARTYARQNTSKKSARKNRPYTVLCAVLCFVLPPVGLMMLWGAGAFEGIPRIVFTAAAVVALTVWIGKFLPSEGIRQQTVKPVPASAQSVRAEDSSDVVAALSNMDALLRSQESTEAAVTEPDTEISSVEAMQKEAEKQATLSTIVYSVWGSKAQYYHAGPTCEGQTNRRELTLAEAMAEKMAACPNCDPVVYRILDTEKQLDD